MHGLFPIVSFLLAAAFSAVVLGCGGDEDEATDAAGTVERAAGTPASAIEGGGDGQTRLQIAAANLEFDKDELTAAANSEVTIEFRNEDEGVLHNLAVYEDESAREALFVGEMFAGADSRTYRFTTPAAGEYFFRCDVHPDTMNGTFRVEA